jgi:hypothetical protein
MGVLSEKTLSYAIPLKILKILGKFRLNYPHRKADIAWAF